MPELPTGTVTFLFTDVARVRHACFSSLDPVTPTFWPIGEPSCAPVEQGCNPLPKRPDQTTIQMGIQPLHQRR